MSRNIVYKVNDTTKVLTKLTNVTPIKENNQTDISYLLAPYGGDTVMMKLLPNKFFELTNVNPIPAFKCTRITDQEVIDAIVPEGDGETGWYLYYFPIGIGVSGILKSNRATQYQVSFQRLEVDLTDDDYIGNYATASTVDATISTELDVAYPSAVAGNYVNVYKTTSNLYTSWLLVSTTWVDQDDLTNETLIDNTLVYNETFKATTVSNDEFNIGTPSEQALVFNQIYGELEDINVVLAAIVGDVAGLMTKAEFVALGLTGIVDKAAALSDETNTATALEVRTALDWLNQALLTTSSPTFAATTVTTFNLYDSGGNAVATYDGTNIIWTYQPDGTGESVSAEMFKNLFVSIVAQTAIVSGDCIMYDGVIGASGKIKGKVVLPSEINSTPELYLGQATQSGAISSTVLVNWYGVVHNLNTSSFTDGDTIYVDSESTDGVNDGGFIATAPTAPNVQIVIGKVLFSHATTGAILVRPEAGHFFGDAHDIFFNGHTFIGGEIPMYDIANNRWTWEYGEEKFLSRNIQNGAIKESFDLRYNTTTSVMVLTKNADDDTYATAPNNLTLQFSDGDTDYDITSVSLAPTFGTTTTIVKNYYYILKSAKVLAVSTASFPSDEHIKIAEVTFLDEVYSDLNGPVGNQNHNNHEMGTNEIGGLQHIRESIRSMGTRWESGVAGATSGEWVTPTTLYWTSTSGLIWQMHKQTYAAKDTSASDDMHIINHNTTPYVAITSFDEISKYSDGSTIGNEHFNVFVYGIINKSGEYSSLFINVPTAGYNNITDAQSDLDQTMVTTVPTEFRRIAFPIARVIIKKQATTYTFIQSYDLREQRFGIGGTGGTGVLDGEFTDTAFEIQNVTDTSKVLKFSAANIPTGSTKTITMATTDVDLDSDVLTPIDVRVEKDLSNDTNYPIATAAGIADDLLTEVYIDDNGTAKKITLNEVYVGANAATGAFVPSGDYQADGLGAYETAVIDYHTLTLDTLGKYKTTIKTMETSKIIYVKMPTISSNTNDLQISTDDGTTYYDVLVNGATIYAELVSAKLLKLQFDGTNFIIDLQSLSQQLTFDSGVNSTYGTVAPINGSPYIDVIKGLSLNFVQSNGQFATDTLWTKGAGYTITGGELVLTAVADTVKAYQDVLPAITTVMWVQYEVTEYTSGGVRINTGTGGTGTARSAVGIYSELLTVTTDTQLQIEAVGTTTAKVDNIMATPIATTPITSKTAPQIANIVTSHKEGYTYISNFELWSRGLNLIDSSQFILGQVLNGSGGTNSNGEYVDSALMLITPNKDFTLSVDSGYQINNNFEFYDYNGDFIEFSSSYTTTISVYERSVNHPTAYYLRDAIRSNPTGTTLTTADFETIKNSYMLNQGTSALTYVAYNSPQDNFKVTADLLSVGTTVRDEVYEDNGVWWKKSYVGIATAVAIGATINTTSIPLILETTGIFYAVDSVNNEAQYGTYGDVLTLTGTSTVYYQLASKTTLAVEQDGSLIQESNTTIVQVGQMATEYEIVFALDNDAQDALDTNKIIQLQYRQDKLEDDVASEIATRISQDALKEDLTNKVTTFSTPTDDEYPSAKLVDDRANTNDTAVGSNTTHRSSDGKNHSDVVLNNTHRSSDGKNHSDVVSNTTNILKRVEFVVLFTNASGETITTNISQASATEITLSEAYTNFDAIKIEFYAETKEVRASADSRSLTWGYGVATDAWFSNGVDYQFSASTTLDIWSANNLQLTPSTDTMTEFTSSPIKVYKVIGIKY